MIPQAPTISPLKQAGKPVAGTTTPPYLGGGTGNPEGPVGITPIGLGQPIPVSDTQPQIAQRPPQLGLGAGGPPPQVLPPVQDLSGSAYNGPTTGGPALGPPPGFLGAGAGGPPPQNPIPGAGTGSPVGNSPPILPDGNTNPNTPPPRPLYNGTPPSSAAELAGGTLGGIRDRNAPNLPDFNSEDLAPKMPRSHGGIGSGLGGLFDFSTLGSYGLSDLGAGAYGGATGSGAGDIGSGIYGPAYDPNNPPGGSGTPGIPGTTDTPPPGTGGLPGLGGYGNVAAPQTPPPINADAGFDTGYAGPQPPVTNQNQAIIDLLAQQNLIAPQPGAQAPAPYTPPAGGFNFGGFYG